jgi:hypothetical protein
MRAGKSRRHASRSARRTVLREDDCEEESRGGPDHATRADGEPAPEHVDPGDGRGAMGVVTLVLAAFFAGVGASLTLEVVTDPGAPDRRTTGVLAVLSLLVAAVTLTSQAFG